MTVYSVSIALVSYYREGANVPPEHFLDPLAITHEDSVESVESGRGRWLTSKVVFPPVRLQDYTGEAEPAVAMNRRLHSALLSVAGFLDKRPAGLFEAFRERGLVVELFVDAWMDQNQMELAFPAAFLNACARHGLTLQVLTNDFAAGELSAGGAS